MLFSKLFETKFLPSKFTNMKFGDNLYDIFLKTFVIIRTTMLAVLVIFHNAASVKPWLKSE